MEAIEAVNLGQVALATDLSIWGLVRQADIVVQAVLVMLVLASIWCWAIIIDKVRRFRRLRDQAEQFEESFWSGGALEDLYERVGSAPEHPLAMLFSVAMREWTLANKRGLSAQDERAQGVGVGGGQRHPGLAACCTYLKQKTILIELV